MNDMPLKPAGLFVDETPALVVLCAAVADPRVDQFATLIQALDAVAGSNTLSQDERLARLDAFAKALDGQVSDDTAPASALFQLLVGTGNGELITHARNLVAAARPKAVRAGVAAWEDLKAQAQSVAEPVARFLLGVAEESDSGAYRALVALGTVLVILERIRDCKVDYVESGRLQLPEAWFHEAAISPDRLAGASACGQTRAVLDRALDGVHHLLIEARPLRRKVRSPELKHDLALMRCLARRMARRLRRRDPLNQQICLEGRDRTWCRIRMWLPA